MTAQPQSEFGLYIDLQAALLRQLPRPEQFSRETLKQLLRQQAALQRGLASLAQSRFDGFTTVPEPNFRYDKRKDGWELRENVPRSITAVADLEPVPFLRDGETSIRGYDLIGRARYELGTNLGQEDAEFLFDHHDEIPVELRQYHLVFTGTIWRSPGGNLWIACLHWGGERWVLGWSWLGSDWFSGGRLLRLRK